MKCHEHCGACCIAPSISSPIPGMPDGKPAGAACIHLSEDFRCMIYGHPDRPKVCGDFMADPEVCGTSREEAMTLLGRLEKGTYGTGSV
ncbi:MAG: YkgJ family cysteine cluster protein [Bacteroidales bacterium]|nr:YkgJ family cysteine cluster protein [Bacteroidales bacterium]